MSWTSATPEEVTRALTGLVRDLDRHGSRLADPSIAHEIGQLTAKYRQTDSLSENEIQQLLHQLVRLCVEADLQPLLSQNNISHPVYNFLKGFEQNAPGPWDREPLEGEISGSIEWDLLGTPIRFPIGVPASVLTANSRWVRYFARRGFNIITYKTVRSVPYKGHDFPHWVFLEGADSSWFSDEEVSPVTGSLKTWPKDFHSFSTANSFGVPSLAPEEWQEDVSAALATLAEGQVLILSVMGTSDPDLTGRSLEKDFEVVSKLAAQTGVLAIELNLSCPNTEDKTSTDGMEEPVCFDADKTLEIVKAVSRVVDTKLIVKLSYMPYERLSRVLTPILPMISAISGINTVQTRVVNEHLQPTFVGTAEDHNRPRWEAGVSGIRIREMALDFVRSLSRLRSQSRGFEIIAMGGVMNGEDVATYREAGADVVQSATAAWVNSRLPIEAERYAKSIRDDLSLERAILSVLHPRISLDREQIASAAKVAPSKTEKLLEQLISVGRVRVDKTKAGEERFARVSTSRA